MCNHSPTNRALMSKKRPQKNFDTGTTQNSSVSEHDYLQAHLFKIGLIDNPLCPLCNSVPKTGEHLFGCPSLLHVRSQDNYRVHPPTNATFVLYGT
ncbi:hypothetical protein TNCV_102781 [Trichonephila clavipes]|nr:hypothetical protein TNCV_102781 [Trichonephila clavipes]